MILNVAIHQSGYRRTRTSSVVHACQFKHLWGKGRRLIKFISSLGYPAISHLKKDYHWADLLHMNFYRFYFNLLHFSVKIKSNIGKNKSSKEKYVFWLTKQFYHLKMKYKENNHSSLAMVFWDFSNLGSAEAGQTWGY